MTRLPFLNRLSPCVRMGLLLGLIDGLAMLVFYLGHGNYQLNPQTSLGFVLVLTVLSFVIVWFVYWIQQYRMDLLTRSLVVFAVLVAALTVAFTRAASAPRLAFVAGVVAGLLVGALVCRYCRGLGGIASVET